MSLLEKLQTLKGKTQEAPPQCDCGSALKGECSECEEEKPKNELLEKLRAAGKNRGVNPPPVVEDSTVVIPGIEEAPEADEPIPYQITEEGKRASETPPPPTQASGVCPVCEKTFQHLSRHKCKGKKIVNIKGTAKMTKAGKIAFGIEPEKEKSKEEAPKAPAWQGYTLFIDCVPMCAHQGASDLVREAAENIQFEFAVEHWSHLEYGKGPGALATRFEKWLLEKKPEGHIVLDTQSLEARAIKHVLKAHASLIVQGIK